MAPCTNKARSIYRRDPKTYSSRVRGGFVFASVSDRALLIYHALTEALHSDMRQSPPTPKVPAYPCSSSPQLLNNSELEWTTNLSSRILKIGW